MCSLLPLQNGLNALHLAAKEGHKDLVEELLERGAPVDSSTKVSMSTCKMPPIKELFHQSKKNKVENGDIYVYICIYHIRTYTVCGIYIYTFTRYVPYEVK